MASLLIVPLVPILPADITLASNGNEEQRPNIVFILADDLGIGNVSCQGLHYTCVQSCGSFGRTLFSNCCKIANPDAAGCH